MDSRPHWRLRGAGRKRHGHPVEKGGAEGGVRCSDGQTGLAGDQVQPSAHFCKHSFIGTQPHSLIYVFSVAAVTTTADLSRWNTKLKRPALVPRPGKVCQPLDSRRGGGWQGSGQTQDVGLQGRGQMTAQALLALSLLSACRAIQPLALSPEGWPRTGMGGALSPVLKATLAGLPRPGLTVAPGSASSLSTWLPPTAAPMEGVASSSPGALEGSLEQKPLYPTPSFRSYYFSECRPSSNCHT